jgi:hypothetical protein
MAALRFRPKDEAGFGVGRWQRWDDHTMSEETAADVWGVDLELAVEDEADPTTLIMLPLTLPARAQAIGVPLP